MQNNPSPAGQTPIPKPGSSIIAASKSARSKPHAAGRSKRNLKNRSKKTANPLHDEHRFDPLEKRHQIHPAAFIPKRGIEKKPWQTTKNDPSVKPPVQEETDDFEDVRRECPPRLAWNHRSRILVAGASAVALVFMAVIFWNSRATPEIPKTLRATAAEIQAFNEAMKLSVEGNPSAALEKLRAVEKRNPEAPSLDYLYALIALQSGEPRAAAEHAESSIRKGIRVSDSLILKSLAESSLTSGMRDSAVVRESLLREAISVDPANPFAMAELAGVLREQGREDEALQLLQAAQAALHPVDSHVVVETSIRLLELGRLPDEKLPQAVTVAAVRLHRRRQCLCEIPRRIQGQALVAPSKSHSKRAESSGWSLSGRSAESLTRYRNRLGGRRFLVVFRCGAPSTKRLVRLAT